MSPSVSLCLWVTVKVPECVTVSVYFQSAFVRPPRQVCVWSVCPSQSPLRIGPELLQPTSSRPLQLTPDEA